MTATLEAKARHKFLAQEARTLRHYAAAKASRLKQPPFSVPPGLGTRAGGSSRHKLRPSVGMWRTSVSQALNFLPSVSRQSLHRENICRQSVYRMTPSDHEHLHPNAGHQVSPMSIQARHLIAGMAPHMLGDPSMFAFCQATLQ